MPNPHGRCKVCKERHVPGKCKEVGNTSGARRPGIIDITDDFKVFSTLLGALWNSITDLVFCIDSGLSIDGADMKTIFGKGTEGAEHLARVKAAMKQLIPP